MIRRHHTGALIALSSVAYLAFAFVDREAAASMILLYIAVVVTLLMIGQRRER